MKIEEGKYYRTRDGRKVGPIVLREGRDTNCAYPWSDNAATEDYNRWWNGCGQLLSGLYDEPGDLVSEWTDEPTGPVITETVKRIVPGVYGLVSVGFRNGDKSRPEVFVGYSEQSPDELRAAAATLLEIADALVKP